MLAPPYSSPTVMPSTPRSPILRHRSMGNWSLRSISAARGAISLWAKSCTASRRASMSSPSWKFRPGSCVIRVSIQWSFCRGAPLRVPSHLWERVPAREKSNAFVHSFIGVQGNALTRKSCGRAHSVGFGHRHQGLLHDSAGGNLVTVVDVDHLGGGHDDAFATFGHAASRSQLAALEAGQKIDLVFHGDHFAVFRQHGKTGISARDVGQRAHGAAMKTTLLLGHRAAVGHGQLHQATLGAQQAHAQRLHHALTGPAGGNAVEFGCIHWSGSAWVRETTTLIDVYVNVNQLLVRINPHPSGPWPRSATGPDAWRARSVSAACGPGANTRGCAPPAPNARAATAPCLRRNGWHAWSGRILLPDR